MVLPIVVAAWVITAATGGAGLGIGAKGVLDANKAKSIKDAAQTRYDTEFKRHNARIVTTDGKIAALGRAQQTAVDTVCARFTRWLEANSQQTELLDRDLADGIVASQRQVSRPGSIAPSPSTIVQGGIQAVGLGMAARAGAIQAVKQIGVASTGTAIKTLSGAAAQKATLAALGGGAVAAGGGGIAVGATVLNVATIGPGVLVAGIQLNSSGAQALTEAKAYSARVDVAVAEMRRQATILRGISARTAEIADALAEMCRRAESQLDQLEAADFDPHTHADLFRATHALIKGVAELVGARVIDEQGDLDPTSAGIAVKYRTMIRN